MPPRKTNAALVPYIEVYCVRGVENFIKAYKYISEYAVKTENEIKIEEKRYSEFTIIVYCDAIRHLRICEYLQNANIVDWN